MNPQMDISRTIMEILDDNAQQVPEGFYLEVCNQLKKLHMDINRKPTGGISRSALEEYERQLNNAADDLHRKELEMRETQNRLNRQARELNDLKAIVNKSVRDYNKCVEKFKEDKRKMEQLCEEKFKEDKRKLEQLEGRIQVREDCLKEREKLMEDFEDNMTLAELQRTLGIY